MLRLFKIVKIEYRGLVNNTILNIQGGIRSCMTYLGAKKLKIFQNVRHL